jgi:GAF domain-containing protein
MIEEPLRVLLVDDEKSLREPLKTFLENDFGYQVDAAADAARAWRLVTRVSQPYDVALIDDLLTPKPDAEPEPIGIELVERIRERHPETECIVFTGWGMARAMDALRAGAYRYLTKPFNLDELGMTIRLAVEQARLRRERDLLSTTLEISNALVKRLDVEQVLEAIAEAVPRLVGAEACAVAWEDPVTGTVQYEPNILIGDMTVQWRCHLRQGSLTRRIIETGEVFALDDADACADELDEDFYRAGVKSFIGVPIPGEPRNQGVLYAYSTHQDTFQMREERQVLKLLADQAGIAIANARMFAKQKEHTKYMDALVGASKGLADTLNLNKKLDLVWRFVRGELGCDTFFIALYDEATNKVSFPIAYDRGKPAEISERVLENDPGKWGLTGYVIKRGQELYWTDEQDGRETQEQLGLTPKLVGDACVSCFLVPLRAGEEMLGAISIQSYEPHTFDPIVKNIFRALAGQVAVSIKNARLYSAAQQRSGELAALLDMARAVSSILGAKPRLEFIGRRTAQICNVDRCSILLLDEEGKRVQPVMSQFASGRLDEDLWRTFKKEVYLEPVEQVPAFNAVIRDREPMVFDETTRLQLPAKWTRPFGVKGLLLVPLVSRDKAIGIMALDYTETGRDFAPGQIRLATTIGSQVAIAFENARLYEQTRQQFTELETLLEASKVLLSSLEIDEVLQPLAEQALQAMDATSVYITDWDEEKNTTTVKVEHFSPEASEAERISDLGMTYYEEELPSTIAALRAREPLMIRVSDPQINARDRDHLLEYGTQAALIIPLLARDRMVGSLELWDSRRERTFTRSEIQFSQTLGNQAAIAIENALLYREALEGRTYIRSLYQASNAIISLRNPDQVLQDIIEKACEAVNGWRANIVLIDEDGRPQRLARVGFDRDFNTDTIIRPEGISTGVMRRGEPILIKDAQVSDQNINPGMVADGVGGAACFPLRHGDKSIGVMWVHYRETQRFPEAELEALRLYANQAAIAYDNARRMRELEYMRSAGEKLASAANVQEVLREIVRSARDVLEADSSVIWSYDDVRRAFLPDELVADGIEPELLEKFREDEPRPDGTAEMVKQREYLEVPDINDPRYAFLGSTAHGLRGEIGVKAFQGIALRVADEEVLGVLYVNYKRPRSFGGEGRKTLETFATHAALALKKARLLEQVQKSRDAARIVAKVSVLENLESTLSSIARGTQHALQCDVVTLYTYDQVKDEFGFPPAMAGVQDTKAVLELGLSARASVLRNILALDKAYVAKDAPSDSLVGGAFVKREGIESSVGIPLKVGERKVGLMFVNYRSRHRFTADELTNIELFANQAAVAIRNAQLYDETRWRAGALQALYEAGKAVTSTLALDTILNHIVEQAWNLIGYYGAHARFSDLELVEGDKLKRMAAYPPGQLAELQRLVGDIDLEHAERIGITGRAAKTGESQLVGDVSQDKDYIEYDPETRSELAVPIKPRQEVIGVINVEHPKADAFDEQAQQVLESLAAQAALAIRNAKLHQERRRRISTLEALYRAGKAITDTVALQDTLDQIVEQVMSLVEGQQEERCFSHLALVEGNVLRFVAACPLEILARLKEWGVIDLEHDSPIGITGWVVKTGRSRNVRDVTKDPYYIEFEPLTRSELAVSIKMDEQVIGVINVEHPRRDAFGESEQRALELLASQAAIAIRKARQNELQQAVYQASKVISREVVIERRELLNRILEQAAIHVRWSQRPKAVLGIIQLHDETTNELCLESVYPPQEFPRLVARLGERRPLDREQAPGGRVGISGRAVLEGKAQRVSDVRLDQDYLTFHPETLSEVDVILRAGDRTLGVLGLESDRLVAFDEMDERFLKSLAELAVIAIQNAQLYEDLRQAQGLVGARTVIAWIGMTSSAWRHTIEKHALTIKEQAQLLCGDLSKARLSGRHTQSAGRLEMIERLSDQILDKPIVPPLSREEGVVLVDVNGLVGERARQLWQNDPYKEVELDLKLQLSDGVAVCVSPEWLRRAFDILVDNAVDAVAGCEPHKITIGTRSANGGVEILVADTGPGIPEEICAKIGRGLIEKPEDAKGLGMGLLMAHAIVQTYGGDIYVASASSAGTTMVIRLPVEKEDAELGR